MMSPFSEGQLQVDLVLGRGSAAREAQLQGTPAPVEGALHAGDDHLSAGRGLEAPRLQEHVDEAGASAQGLAPGAVDLTDHGDELALVLLDLHLHLRVHEEVAGEEGRELSLDLGHA